SSNSPYVCVLSLYCLSFFFSFYFFSSVLSLVFFSLFLFFCFAVLLDLHSFPTRRSSDLAVHGAAPGRGAAAGPACASPTLGQGRDRKSTRLNSSHVSISYAVFCLKKKKS